jgi:hypothetical protein
MFFKKATKSVRKNHWCGVYLNLVVFLFWGKFWHCNNNFKNWNILLQMPSILFLIKEILVFEKNVISLLNFWGKLWIFFLKKFTYILNLPWYACCRHLLLKFGKKRRNFTIGSGFLIIF